MEAVMIKARYLLAPDGLKKDWGIRIEDGRITEARPFCEMEARAFGESEADGAIGSGTNAFGESEKNAFRESDPRVLDLGGQIILPGFVNGHHHMYGVLSHGITAETMVSDFSDFLGDFWWPCVENRVTPALARLTAKWACAEMIESGVTAFADILEAPNALPGALWEEREAVEQSGLRGLLSFEACERVSSENGKLGLQENENFIKETRKSDSLVKGFMSIHTLFTCSAGFIREADRISREQGCPLHMHLSESDYEPNWTKEHYGKTPVEVYAELGCLGEHILASQLVQVSDREIGILASHGVKGVSMPLSNCEVGGGIAPVHQLLQSGMTLGLGTDGYINNFFEVMRGAFLIHKGYLKDPQAMPASLVYRLATEYGAGALGLESGRLEPGRPADLITVSTDTPTPVNEHNIYDQLILYRNPEHVKNVMVNGRWLKRDGRLLTINKEETRLELSEMTAKFWESKRR